MADPVNLLFGVHAHQPAGNFPAVVRHAHERCYRPFFEALDRHPSFPFALHISGWLMEFLFREFPEDMERVRAMVERGQVELFGGGYTEPVLAAISETDRRGQLSGMNKMLWHRFHIRPRGAWLTERVWEATVVPALADNGIGYVAVDDYHFLCAGCPAGKLDGHYTTEEDGRALDLLPISEALRYRIPFAPIADVLGHLEHLAPGGAAIYFDDIEKFGIWPETFDWVYGRRWLEDFLDAVAASPKIRAMHYADYYAQHQSRGVVYLPTVSYFEMSEWTLPKAAASRFTSLIARAKSESTFDADKIFLRGGQWRNFFSRYPESNWMHKRMLHASLRYHLLPKDAQTRAMLANLHLGQANDAYWHGLFGGIYLPHLRRQVYSALARLERAMNKTSPPMPIERRDLDFDGHVEILLRSSDLFAAIKPEDGASVCELTNYRLAHNFADVLARREEHYFEKIRANVRSSGPQQHGIASIHDRVAYRSEITEDDLEADRFPRALFVDFWQPDGGEMRFLRYAPRQPKQRGLAAGRFSHESDGLHVAKDLRLRDDALVVRYEVEPSGALGTFSVELNVAMPSCDGPGGRYIVGGQPLGGFDWRVRVEGCPELLLSDSELAGQTAIVFAPACDMTAQPLYTVSQSESGFEKIMQASTIRASWRIEAKTAIAIVFVARAKRRG
jgi:4-alpha-glucanotransferase